LTDILERLPPPGPSERALTVLAVDDEPLILGMLVDCLEKRGFTVLEAGCAISAIQMMSYGDFAIDGIVTDIQMPGEIDGVGLVNWARCNRPQIPIIVTSGFYSEVAQAAGRSVCFFRKPYDCDAVAARLFELMRDTNQ
jgi:CheY-like chemotaxis protein